MAPEDREEPQDGSVEIASDYVRPRHCVVHRGEFGPLWEDLDLHLLQQGLALEPGHRTLLREALAVCALHHANRPRNELTGFTVNIVGPTIERPINLFVTGDSEAGTVTGRIFTRDVKTGETGRLFAQMTRPRLPVRESVVPVEGMDALAFGERYHRLSEQLPARFFRLGDDELAMVVAQPDYDEAWFETVGARDVARIARDEELGPLERRRYRFRCGCDANRIMRVLRDATKGDVGELYGDETELRVECPRCAAGFIVRREELERFLGRG